MKIVFSEKDVTIISVLGKIKGDTLLHYAIAKVIAQSAIPGSLRETIDKKERILTFAHEDF